MRNTGTKITFKKIVESRPFLFLLGVLLLLFAWSVLRFWGKMAETGRNKDLVEQKALALREKKAKLESDIERLNTEEGKEEFFRENYGFAKAGEELIVVVEDKNKGIEPNERERSGFWAFIVNLFK